jgi:hypothetical protein
MSSPVGTADGVVSLDRDHAADLFDRIARKHMDMSGAEFLRRWDSGEYASVEWDSVEGLAEVAMALPLAR